MNEYNSNKLFLKLSENFGHDWKTLGRYLGLRTADIENIEADHAGQRERGFQVLLFWTRRGIASRTALYNALMTVDPSGAIFQYLAANQ